MPRRKSQNEEDDPKTPVKRVTRSSASQTTTPLANVDTNGNSPLKRPGRLLSAIDEDDDNTTPTKRNKRRRNDQIHNTPKRKVEDDERTGLEKPGRGDNLKQGTIDTPTGSRKQVVFDSVEIITPRKSTRHTVHPRETSPTPNARKTPTRTYGGQPKRTPPRLREITYGPCCQ